MVPPDGRPITRATGTGRAVLPVPVMPLMAVVPVLRVQQTTF